MNEIVDWQLLPYQPVQFFKLKPDCDRRDLKRAYGKLIRRFKPESHPQEFQKIRRAYEELENQVRYGIKQASLQRQTEAWNAVVESKPNHSQPRANETVESVPSLMELAIAQPKATYRQIQQSPTKSPQDYFILAVLSDLVLPSRGNRFLQWILQGVIKHPTDAGLQQILREFMRTDVETKQAVAILQACSKSLRGDVFYRMTEPLWDRLIRQKKFDLTAKLLTTCEKVLKQKDGPARVTFYLHLMRPGIWKAPVKWTNRVMAFLESQGAHLDPAADHELEFLSLVHEYLKNDRQRIGGQTIRRLLDEMIQAYCLEDWNESVAKVAQVQHEVARNSHGVIEAFPMADVEQTIRLFSLCMMISTDVAEQTAVGFSGERNKFAGRQSAAALSDLRDSIITVGSQIEKKRRLNFVMPFLGIVVVPVVFLASLGTPLLFNLILGLVAVLGYFVLLKPKVLDPRAERKTEEVLTNAYQEQWRMRLFRYIQSCGQEPKKALENLHSTAASLGDGNWMNVVLSFINRDIGLMMFGNAQMFVS